MLVPIHSYPIPILQTLKYDRAWLCTAHVLPYPSHGIFHLPDQLQFLLHLRFLPEYHLSLHCSPHQSPHYLLAQLSKATLLAQQKSNEAKTRSILQLTYGRVPEWRPFNFRKNVLVYDIHEQLRTLLVEIRDSVLMLSGETDSDKVTVDLVYCYPDDNYSGRLPEPSPHYGLEGPENVWRLITSGDASCINYTLLQILCSPELRHFRQFSVLLYT